jgi:plastocyanin
MPFTWQITIKKKPGATPPFTYEPATLDGVAIGDQIIWTNADDKPHWPGAAGNPSFYMANQIAPDSPSTTFVPSASGTLKYSDSLTQADPGGTIVVG